MSATAAHVAHHFDDADQQYEAAGLGMWLFLATEVLFFGGLFAAYTVYRYWYPAAFSAGSHHLDIVLGTINTSVLLASSLTMALAVHAAQTSHPRAIGRFLAWTMILGSVFLGIKAYEYYHKYTESLVPGPNFSFASALGNTHAAEHTAADSPPAESLATAEAADEPSSIPSWAPTDFDEKAIKIFFSLYFVMTGLHAVHMVIGLVILGILYVAARRGTFSADYFTPVEMTGLYWHFVDIVWVFLFPLLYLVH